MVEPDKKEDKDVSTELLIALIIISVIIGKKSQFLMPSMAFRRG